MTPRDLIRNTADVFRRAGIPDPEYDSAMLLSSLTGRSSLPLRMDTDTVLDEDMIARFQALCSRRIGREPLQYILSDAYFCGFRFHVDHRVLIPRPETELLCEWALEKMSGFTHPKGLDLCCGSGCIGITLKLRMPLSFILASDLSGDALDVAKLNASRLGADVSFIRSDLFSALPDESFDLIISNPPYIPSAECRNLQPEVMSEPLSALDGGDDGLAFYRQICRESPRHLRNGGFLLMELGDGESESVIRMMREAGFSEIEMKNDYQSLPRMICGKMT